MGKAKRKKSQQSKDQESEAPEATWINKVAEVVSSITARLPTKSGDLLNFGADILAALLLIYLWDREFLLPDQVLLSLTLTFSFMLLCFAGTLLMRFLDNSEKPG